jgi:uncharacterized phage protein gp47/JayE
MQLTVQNFSTLVANMSAAARSSYGGLLDISAGSVLRAIMESSASTALWLQYLTLQVLQSTRLSTSTGSDVDSWVGDFGLVRLLASPATGTVTMTSLSPASQSAVIANGATVRSADGTVTFSVINGPYTRAVGVASIDVEVEATISGIAGNVAANTITLLASAIAGVDTVTNQSAFVTGADAETDAAVRSRFVDYINTRARATTQAVVTAVASVKQGLTSVVLENSTTSGAVLPGHFLVVVDDGTGSPGADLLSAVAVAVDSVRPLGSSFSVTGPVVVDATIDIVITSRAGAAFSTIQSSVIATVNQFVSALAVAEALPFSRLLALAYAADDNVINVAALLNGSTSDLGGAPTQVVRIASLSVKEAAVQ